ncbi:MAG: N-acetylmuramoyl-L-alanine amidase [Phycisphaerae bacterium]
MPAVAARHQHRHLKTLIVLVLSMTGGTYFLFWIAQFSPVTPLRASVRNWTKISVRAESDRIPGGFYHYRVDETGRLFQSRAWETGQYERNSPGTIHILLSCGNDRVRVSPEQAKTLSRILSTLRRDYIIPVRNVVVDTNHEYADPSPKRPDTSRRT